ncbi:MAG: hypothetical protein ACP5FH_07325 [Terracidiphilus sp.]
MRDTGKLFFLGALGFVGAGLLLAGCKSAPDLTQSQAQALIQAKYDQMPAAGANITIDEQGLAQGVADGYWVRTKLYPNRYWADFTLTPEGKKAVTLPGGGDVIQWRPDTPASKNFSVVVVTVVAHHLQARGLKEIQDETIPGVSTAKGVEYSEAVNLDGVPGPLVDIAHNPGNQLSVKRQADFALVDGVWKLHSIE